MKTLRSSPFLIYLSALIGLTPLLCLFADAQRPGSVDLDFQVDLSQSSTLGLIPSDGSSAVEDIALLPDGRIYIGGHLDNVGGQPSDAVARLLPNGSLDSTFRIASRDGSPRCGLLGCDTHRIVLQPDGKLIAGYHRVRRFLLDGSLDPNFAVIPDTSVVALDDRGRVFLRARGDSSLVRRLADGSPDPNFRPFNSFIQMMVTADEKYLGAVPTELEPLQSKLIRFNDDGSRDTTFREPTFEFRVNIDGSDKRLHAVTIDSSGRILAAGQFNVVRTSTGQRIRKLGLARLLTDGEVDSTFDASLFIGPAIDIHDHYPICVGFQTDGKILVGVGGNFVNTNSAAYGGIVRLHPDGSLDSSFNVGTGVRNGEPRTTPGRVKRIVVQPDGQILISGQFKEVDGIERYAIARLNGDSRALRLQNPLRQLDGSVQISVSASASTTFVLEAASSLSAPNWQPLSTNTTTASPVTITDTDATKFPRRFYRAVSR